MKSDRVREDISRCMSRRIACIQSYAPYARTPADSRKQMTLLSAPHRTAKQLRERWHNHLDPAINKGPWTEAEDKLLIVAQNMLGNRFAEIAKLVLLHIDTAHCGAGMRTALCTHGYSSDPRAAQHRCERTRFHLQSFHLTRAYCVCVRARACVCVCAGARKDRQPNQEPMARDLQQSSSQAWARLFYPKLKRSGII